MSYFSGIRSKAAAVTGVACVTLSAYYLTQFYHVPDGSEVAVPDEPEIAAAQPVQANAWSALDNINSARFESTAIQYQGDMYVFNGFGLGIKVEPDIEKYDADTQSWSIIGTTSIGKGNAVTHNGVVVVDNEVWIIGGRVGNHPGAVTSKVWKFNLITYQWTPGPALPVPVAAGGAALVNDRIHWFGGLDQNAACDVPNHYVYDLNNPSAGWSDISGMAPMPVPRNHFATVVHQGLIYAIGGQFTHDGCGPGTPNTNLVHAFDPQTNIWTQKANLPAVVSHTEPSTFAHKGAIYVVGAQINGNKVYRYDPAYDDWDTVAILPNALLAPIAQVVNDQLFVSSGGQGLMPSYKTYAIDMAPLLLPYANGLFPEPESNVNQSTELSGEAGLVTLEAENYDTISSTSTHNWVATSLAGASNSGAMTTTPDTGALANGSQGSPSMGYLAYFDRPGTWYLWVRGWGDTVGGEGKSDSLHAGLNGSLKASADKIDKFPAGWHWSKSTRDGARATLNVPAAGLHAVDLWMREDGLAVDKILLTTDPDYTPTGKGPDEDDISDTLNIINEADESIEQDNSSDTNLISIVDSNIEESSSVDSTDASIDTTPASQTDSTDVADAPDSEISDTDNTSESTNSGNEAAAHHGIITLEVEDFDNSASANNINWIRSIKPGASGNASMVTNTDKGVLKPGKNGSPQMSYQVHFKEQGTYTVWLRGWGDTVNNEGKSDSAHVGLNGTLGSAAAIQNFPAKWQWSNQKRSGGSATLVVPAPGVHTVNIWMREDGLFLDKLILAKDPAYIPNGFGPAAGQAEPSSPSIVTTVDSQTADTTTNTESNETADQAMPVDFVSIEAEHFDTTTGASNITWVRSAKAGASGEASMVTSSDTGILKPGSAGSPVMNYEAHFTQPGVYTVWVRGYGDTVANEGKSDSVHVGINGTLGSAAAIQNFPASWQWSNSKRSGGSATLYVPSAGMHTINIWMREDGLFIDKLLLAKDPSFAPTDDGPASTNPPSATASTGGSQSAGPTQSSLWKSLVTANGSKVQKRHEAGGVVHNGKIYVLGGRGIRNVSVYDPATNKWTVKSAPSMSLSHFQPVAFDNKIWVLGAFTGPYPNEISVADIYTYTPATDTWAKEGTIPQHRRRGAAGAVLYDGYIYLVGGNTNGHKPGAKPWLDRYNPRNGQWETLPDAPDARDHVTVSVSNHQMVVTAGRQSAFPNVFANTIASTNIYDFKTQSWRAGKPIPTVRAGAMTVTAGNEVVVIGGEVGNDAMAKDTVESYNVNSNRWQQLKPLNVGRHSGAAVVLNNKIHVISGSEKKGGAPESVAHEVMPY